MQKNYDLWIKFTPKEHFWHETKKNPIVINKQVRPRSFILLNKKLKLPEITNKTTNNPSSQKNGEKFQEDRQCVNSDEHRIEQINAEAKKI